MIKEKHFPPKHATGEFHCPHCNVYAKQRWAHLKATGDNYSTSYHVSNIKGLALTSFNLPEKMDNFHL